MQLSTKKVERVLRRRGGEFLDTRIGQKTINFLCVLI